MKEGVPFPNNVPEEERADMTDSPVTAEEMRAAVAELQESVGTTIPEAEQVDMANSPVTAEEMRAAVEGLHAPDVAPVDLAKEASPVPEIGTEVAPEEIVPIPQESEKENTVQGVQEIGDSDEARLNEIRAELKKDQQGVDSEKELGVPPILPPEEIPDDGGEDDSGGERGPRIAATSESELTYKKCEKCKGAGRLFGAASFIPFIGKILDQCSECDGKGQIVSGKRAKETIYHY